MQSIVDIEGKNGLFDDQLNKYESKLSQNDISLKILIIKNIAVSTEQFKRLFNVLTNNTSLLTILLVYVPLSLEKLNLLYQHLKVNKSITSLNLGGNKFSKELIESMGEFLTINQTLKYLYLNQCDIDLDGIKCLAGAIALNKMLIGLEVNLNNIDEVGAEAIANALEKNKTLKVLSLNKNLVKDKGAELIFKAIVIGKSLQILNLEQNNLSDEIAKPLINFLRANKSVYALNLTANNLGDNVIGGLAQTLPNNKILKSLNLNQISFNDNNIDQLVKSLALNKTLLKLSIDSGKITAKTLTLIIEFFNNNTTLKNINISTVNLDKGSVIISKETLHKIISPYIIKITIRNESNEQNLFAFINFLRKSVTLLEFELRISSQLFGNIDAEYRVLKNNSKINKDFYDKRIKDVEPLIAAEEEISKPLDHTFTANRIYYLVNYIGYELYRAEKRFILNIEDNQNKIKQYRAFLEKLIHQQFNFPLLIHAICKKSETFQNSLLSKLPIELVKYIFSFVPLTGTDSIKWCNKVQVPQITQSITMNL